MMRIGGGEGWGARAVIRGEMSPSPRDLRVMILANSNGLFMKTLSVQIQPDLVPDVDLDAVLSSLARLAGTPRDVRGAVNANGRYISLNFVTRDAPRLWKAIESRMSLPSDPLFEASKGITIICEGEKGWSDYLLLYHFDTQKILDMAQEQMKIRRLKD